MDKKDGQYAKKGDLADASYETLRESIKLYDQNRPLNHIAKIQLVKGDAVETIPKFFKDNPFLFVALLYMDFDLYTATKVALEIIIPRMPKGSIIAFDELNDIYRQGETVALLERFNINDFKIEKFHEDPHISWIQL